jgi:iron complex transport system substrate-binding protein
MTPVRSTRTGPALDRRHFLVGAAAVLGVAACGDSGSDDGAGGAPSGTRTVQGSRGPVEVPAEPKRIAALVGSNDIDVLAFGITPVYAGSFAEGWLDIPDGVVTSDAVPPSVEAVGGTRPDLLLGWDWLADEPSWAQLTKLAPAVPLPEDRTWQDTFRVLADAVNRKAQGEELLSEFARRAAALKAQRTAAAPVQVAHIDFVKPGTVTIYGQDRDTTAIMREVGLDVQGPAETAQDASIERLPEITAPWLIAYGYGEEGRTALASVKGTPLWQNLPAVRAGHVVEVESGVWTGAGYLWAKALVDDIEKNLLSRL